MSLLTPLLRTHALTDFFSDEQTVQGMLDFEAVRGDPHVSGQANCGRLPR